jgi:predicted PurR-regulated permease PerM
MRNAIGVPPFVVVTSLLVGTALAGIVGALLSVPFSAALVVILERAQARDAPVPLEGPSSSGPSEDEIREESEKSLPDDQASVAADH